ncbi:MAG: hypothetical protein D6798_08725, partial [Deltaproteobacteria bacterium]
MRPAEAQRLRAVLERAAALVARQRHGDAARLLGVVLRAPDLPSERRCEALRLRAESWLGMGMERRAWRDLSALLQLAPGDPWARLQRARLLGRHARTEPERADALAEALAIARAHPDLVLAWRVAEELAGNQPRMGLQAEIIIGRARADHRDVDATCRAARVLVQRGQHDDALVLLDGCGARRPADWRRLDRCRAEVLYDARRIDALARILPSVRPGGPAAARWLSRAWLVTGDIDRALRVLLEHRPATPDPEYPAWRLAVVELYCRRGELDAARRFVEAAPPERPPGPGDDARLVWLAARGAWTDIVGLADRPWDRPQSRVLVAEALRRCGPSDGVKEHLAAAQAMVQVTPPPLLLNRLMVEPMDSLAQACAEAFAPMLDESPPEDGAARIAWLRQRADALLDRLGGVRDEVLTWRRRDGTIGVYWPRPDVRSAVAAVRQSLTSLGLDGTIGRYRTIQNEYLAGPSIHTYRAELCLWRGDLDEAERGLRRALALDMRTRWAYIGFAQVELWRGCAERAVTAISDAERMVGAMPSSPHVLAEAHLRLGNLAEAEKHCIAALRHRPSRVSA